MPSSLTTIQTSAPTMASVASPKALGSDAATFQPESDLWVALRNPPSDYSHHEALLLCEIESGNWVAWVPGYGEIMLNRSQFYQSEEA